MINWNFRKTEEGIIHGLAVALIDELLHYPDAYTERWGELVELAEKIEQIIETEETKK